MTPNLNLADLKSEKPSVRYGCTKRVLTLSEKNPKALYSKLAVFVRLLGSENRIFKWTAILVIGNLACVDLKNRIDRLVPKLISFLQGKELITAANSIKALGQIARAKPKLRAKILKEFLSIEKARYYNKGRLSPECRNVALGQVLTVLGGFILEVSRQKETRALLRRQTRNSRPAVREKAKYILSQL